MCEDILFKPMNFNHVSLHICTDNHIINSSTLRLKQAGFVRNSSAVDRTYFSKLEVVQNDHGLKKLLPCSELQTERDLAQKYTIRSSLN